jgi:hypothetical protein
MPGVMGHHNPTEKYCENATQIEQLHGTKHHLDNRQKLKMKGTEHYNRTKDGHPGQLRILLQPSYMKGMP